MTDALVKDLEKIGLSENEAKVYLASLELGPATAQQLAAKAIVSRPNTYIMIESLKKRGLMSSFEKGKKKYFVAGEPRQLLYVIEQKKNQIAEEEDLISKFISKVHEIKKNENNTAKISVYEGEDARMATKSELTTNDQELFEIVPVELARKYFPPIFSGDIRESYSKKFPIKSICTGGPTRVIPTNENIEVKYADPEMLPIKSELLVFGNKVIISTFKDKPLHVHIEDGDIAQTLKTIFKLIWKHI
jgi:sugar-specific transcriptional regulator TrmB